MGNPDNSNGDIRGHNEDTASQMNVLALGNGYLGDKFRRHGFPVWGRDRFEIDAHGELRFVSWRGLWDWMGRRSTRNLSNVVRVYT